MAKPRNSTALKPQSKKTGKKALKKPLSKQPVKAGAGSSSAKKQTAPARPKGKAGAQNEKPHGNSVVAAPVSGAKKPLPVSPLAPKAFPALPPLSGVRLGAGMAGVRYQGRTDVMLAVLAPGTTVAGVLTQSKTSSAPVEWCRANLAQGQARVLVVNSGNANAFTGQKGVDAVRLTAQSVAAMVGCKPQEVFLASTGVIGEPLPAQKIVDALPDIYESTGAGGWRMAAEAIMTTDTFPKMAAAVARIEGAKATINGFAKGSGMIAPDMATMLAFLFTDAALSAEVLQSLVSQCARDSFNAITVDGDTSTSDTVLAFATGKGAHHTLITKPADKRLEDFREKLQQVMTDLALQVVRDGEGATKLVSITVNGAENFKAARTIAMAIGNSPLVKTAIAGGDANWGRIVMAVGKAGEAADRDKLSIRFGGRKVATNGMRDPSYDEKAASAYMAGREIAIEVDVGVGKASARIWTCDLTHGYIAINGDYRS